MSIYGDKVSYQQQCHYELYKILGKERNETLILIIKELCLGLSLGGVLKIWVIALGIQMWEQKRRILFEPSERSQWGMQTKRSNWGAIQEGKK